MKTRNLLCLFLCALMICSCLFVACGEDETEDVSKTESKSPEPSNAGDRSDDPDESEDSSLTEESSEDPYRDADGRYVSKNLPEFKDEWEDYTEFRVLVYNKDTQDTYFSEEIEPCDTTDDKIAEGVIARNKWIEDTYGIKIKAVAVPNVFDAFRTQMSGGGDTFDIAMPFMNACSSLAQEGSLYNLYEFSDYISFDAPWWDSNATESLSIANKIYFTTGDISLMQKIVSNGVAFNKTLMESYAPDIDLYQQVREKKWTLDAYYELCRMGTMQGDDIEKMDENDKWGAMGGGIGLYYGSGETLCKKNADDIPMIALGEDQRSIDVAQKVLGMLGEKNTWYITVNDFTVQAGKWNTSVKIFGENQALFMCFAFSAIKKFRPYDVDFGVLPIPMYNTDQDDYFSQCAANWAYGVCIPLNSPDPEFCAYMMELLAVGGKNYISDAYYTSVLKGKDMGTDNDEDMLDIIFGNIVYDVAIVYNFKGITDLFNNSTKDTIVSDLAAQKGAIEDAIQDVVDAFNSAS